MATALSKSWSVTLLQNGRSVSRRDSSTLEYAALDDLPETADAIIVVRKPRLLFSLRKRYPKAKTFLWLHNFPRFELTIWRLAFWWLKTTVVGVSKHHANTLDSLINRHPLTWLLPPLGIGRHVPVEYVYNPVDSETLNAVEKKPYQRNKLVFYSSPNKGLKQVLELFTKVRARYPLMELHLGNPGYVPDDTNGVMRSLLMQPGVVVHGPLPQAEILMHVRESLCVFYPQTVFPETFGLVLAEANAVGTPVIAHAFGAATEVLGANYQAIDCRSDEAVMSLLDLWYNGERPNVRMNPMFTTAAAASRWHELLVKPTQRSKVRSSIEISEQSKTVARF
jgi:glycosyltransferase involved in cell wall biosynthesis